MLLVIISSIYCTENELFFISLLEGLGNLILILIEIKISHDFIHTNLYKVLKKKFFQYLILHIMTFQALIEGYSRSKSYMNFSSN